MIEQRLFEIRQVLKDQAIDMAVIGPTANFKWLTGHKIHGDERPSMVLISQSNAVMLLPKVNIGDPSIFAGLETFIWTDNDDPNLTLTKAIEALGIEDINSVALDEAMRADFALMIQKQCPNAALSSSADSFGLMRMKKNASEYAELKMNSDIADEAILAVKSQIKAGMKEKEVATIVKDIFAKHGASICFIIVGAGPNGASPHHMTGDTIIEDGDAIVLDIGCRKGLFSSDITRMIHIGEPSAKYMEVHETVERAVQAAMQAAKVGVAAKSIDDAARGVIEDAGYGEYFVHRTGHGMGLEGHELPYINAANDQIIEEGMVFSIEPGIYLPNEFGVRLEEIVIMEKDGAKIISDLPRDLMIIK